MNLVDKSHELCVLDSEEAGLSASLATSSW